MAGWAFSAGLLLLVGLPSAADELFTLFPASSGPMSITTGPDGNLWFTEVGFGVGRITPSGVVTQFNLVPPLDCPNDPPGCWGRGITAGPDGNLWFVNWGSNPGLARITTSGLLTPIPSVLYFLQSITAGADGNLWTAPIGDSVPSVIAKVTPSGGVTLFSIPSQTRVETGVYSLALGPDGNVWFTEFDYRRVGKITPSGQITQFPLPTSVSNYATAGAITGGPDGAVWFTARGVKQFVCRITTDGQVMAFPVSDLISDSSSAICGGPDGSLWFAGEGFIGRCTTAGQITKFPVSVPNGPYGITSGPDGNIWVTVPAVGIGRFDLGVLAEMEGRSVPAVGRAGLVILGLTLASAGFFLSRSAKRA